MAHVHFFLNPKGGTGKSLVSYIVAQYLISKGVKTTCIDCDPVTPTLIAYEALHAVRVNIMVENNIDKTKFDRFVELIAQGEENEHFVIDNGTIVEEGNAAQLMEKKGAYYKLYMSQFKNVM